MKKAVLVLIGLLACVSAYADYTFDKFYTTHGVGDRTEDSTFFTDEIPYLYIQTPFDNTVVSGYPTYITFWKRGTGGAGDFISHGGNNDPLSADTREFWITPQYWFAAQAEGSYSVEGSFHFARKDPSLPNGFEDVAIFKQFSPYAYTMTNRPLTVTPEPGSIALFALGGVALAIARRMAKMHSCQ